MKKKINVLFAPANTASMPDITLQALNRLDSVDAKGISFANHHYWTFGPNWKIFTYTSFRKNPLKRILEIISSKWALWKGIYRADLLMWHWDIEPIDYWMVRLMRKPIFVEWIGSDIRVPDFLFNVNPYYKKVWDDGEWDYMQESKTRSDDIQKRFRKLNATALLCPEISLFLNPQYFSSFTLFYQRIDLKNYTPRYPDPQKNIPTLVHTPSAKGTKGTKYVRQAIENLKKKGLPLEYIEIHNKTRQEALNAIGQADIFIDQFIVGSYGLATCEAMAMGKPVLCYLMPCVTEKLPVDCPIVNTTLETLETTLEEYILQPDLRNKTGQAGRRFVEAYHDADKIALQLEKIYKETLRLP